MTNSTNDSLAPIDLSYYYQHIGFGLTAVVTNCLIILILFLNPNLLKKSAFVFTLAVGDGIEGLALALSGFARVNRNADGTLYLKVHPTYCMQSYITLFLIGVQLPAIMFVLIGGERFTAVYYFDWYYKHWSNRLAWLCCCIVALFVAASVFVGWLVTYTTQDDVQIAITCSIGDAIDDVYSVYNYMLAIIGGILAAIASIAAIIMFSKRKQQMLVDARNTNLALHIKRQLHVTRVLLCTTIADFVLTVIPCVFVMLTVGFNMELPANLAGWSLRLISCRSALNILVYLIFNGEFRRATLKAVGMNNVVNGNKVGNYPGYFMTVGKNNKNTSNFTK